jgi:3-methyladenine DNA glycosylase AlkD
MRISSQVISQLKSCADPARARHSQKYFKTAKGEYGSGDRFLGVRVPAIRKIARQFKSLSLADYEELIASPWHEVRLLALIVLVDQFRHANLAQREKIYRSYMRHRRGVNNWDLVDTSAPTIVGGYFRDRDRVKLYDLLRSSRVWDRRIAVMACFSFIRDGEFDDGLRVAECLLRDRHDLVQKAVGWLLREIGNRDRVVEEMFLRQHCHEMPRVMLRYAIEKFPASRRKSYLGNCGTASTGTSTGKKPA